MHRYTRRAPRRLRFPREDTDAIAYSLGRLADSHLRGYLRNAGLVAADDFRPHALITRLEDAFVQEGCPLPMGEG